MRCGTYTLRKIPDDQVHTVVAGFAADTPISLTRMQDADGTWTVVAVYPPCSPGTQGGGDRSYQTLAGGGDETWP